MLKRCFFLKSVSQHKERALENIDFEQNYAEK